MVDAPDADQDYSIFIISDFFYYFLFLPILRNVLVVFFNQYDREALDVDTELCFFFIGDSVCFFGIINGNFMALKRLYELLFLISYDTLELFLTKVCYFKIYSVDSLTFMASFNFRWLSLFLLLTQMAFFSFLHTLLGLIAHFSTMLVSKLLNFLNFFQHLSALQSTFQSKVKHSVKKTIKIKTS